MAADDKEHQRVYEDIIGTVEFRRAPGSNNLLKYLYENRQNAVDGKVLAEKVLQIKPVDYAALSGRLRTAIGDLRDKLEIYNASNRLGWRCELPISGDGYQLEFSRLQSDSELFWRPHLDAAEQVSVICASQLFFYDSRYQSMLRFHDVNLDGEAATMLANLKARHPDAYDAHLQPTSLYLSAGEVITYETLQRWFFTRTNFLIPRKTSRETTDREVLNISPILLGRPATNKHLRRLMDSRNASHFGYRFTEDYGAIQIQNPTAEEQKSLGRFGLKPDGRLGPIKDWETVFGIVTRLPHSTGGFATMISADFYVTTIAQIATALTNDQRVKQILAQMNWPSAQALPESFEMLFSVRVASGGYGAEEPAEFLCWRKYPAKNFNP